MDLFSYLRTFLIVLAPSEKDLKRATSLRAKNSRGIKNDVGGNSNKT